MGDPFSWASWAGGTVFFAALAWPGLEAREAPAPEPAAGLVTEIEPARITHRPPRFISVAPAMAREGKPYRYDFAAMDPDGEALSYSLIRAPEGAKLEGQVLEWVPVHRQAGHRERFVLRAVDEHGAAREQSWTVLPRQGVATTLQHLRASRTHH